MKVFGSINANDQTVEEYFSTAPLSWQLQSSSAGITVTYPEGLTGAVTIQRASNDPINYRDFDPDVKVNIESGIYEYVLYSSVKHVFYDRGEFYSGSRVYQNPITIYSSSIDPTTGYVVDNTTKTNVVNPPDESYVVSVGQNFYGDRIKPGSFRIEIDSEPIAVQDDGLGSLFVSESGNGYVIGNVFYREGVAVIKHDISVQSASVSGSGIKIVSGSTISLDYSSEVVNTRHEISVRLAAKDFNFSPFNPSIIRTYSGSSTLGNTTGPLYNVPSSSTTDNWNLYTMMSSNAIKPYVTSIGLYNDKYELLAVAKLAIPIQRTFSTEQIFIIRFDTE